MIDGPGVSGVVVSGCYIGTDAKGLVAVPNVTVAFPPPETAGIVVKWGAKAELGGDEERDRNVISGNGEIGILFTEAAGGRIAGNFIGVDRTGNGALSNRREGICIYESGPPLIIDNNVIAGNGGGGIRVDDTDDMEIVGNHIGVGEDGRTMMGNRSGIVMQLDIVPGSCKRNKIGGPTPEERNVIAGSAESGIWFGTACEDNVIEGNYIGLDAGGTLARANGRGIDLGMSRANRVVGNVISGNSGHGIHMGTEDLTKHASIVFPATRQVIAGNNVGLSADGAAAVPNGGSGIVIAHGSWLNTLGGPDPRDGNIVSGNALWGVEIGGPISNGPESGARTQDNQVSGNWIGVAGSGDAEVGNRAGGIRVLNSSDNVIGGMRPSEKNVVSGNRVHGLAIYGRFSTGNRVLGNFIGLAPDGLSTMGNRRADARQTRRLFLVRCRHQSVGVPPVVTKLAAPVPVRVTTLEGTRARGITISGQGTDGNAVEGNAIGLLVDRTAAGNANAGVAMWGEAQDNRTGGMASGEGNTIAHQGETGILIWSASTTGNAIFGNAMYDNATIGAEQWGGIELWTSSSEGPSPNDHLDADEGPNGMQNHPKLESAALTASGLVVSGVLESKASQTYRIELFVSPVSHGSGYGEGRFYLGAVPAITTEHPGGSLIRSHAAFHRRARVGGHGDGDRSRIQHIGVLPGTGDHGR